MTPEISVVSPLYRSSNDVAELLARLRSTLHGLDRPWEVVLVDDCCPDGSGRVAAAHVDAADPVRILRLDRNVGQLTAVNLGIAETSGDVVVVLDADLQDRPEDVAALVGRLGESGVDVVAAGRDGRYTSAGRGITARAFRSLRSVLTGGRVPGDAGLFLAANRTAVDRVLALDDPGIHLVSGLARVRAPIVSIKVARSERAAGHSTYSWWRRSRVAAAALLEVTPLYPGVRRARRRRWSAPRATWIASRRPGR